MMAAGKAWIKGAQEMRVGGRDPAVRGEMFLLPPWMNIQGMIRNFS